MGVLEESLKLCPDAYIGRNYQKELERILEEVTKKGSSEVKDRVPSLLLHSCCAPCSSYVISYLSDFFKITVFYFNPNISDIEEYNRRVEEQKRFIKEYKTKNKVDFIEGRYDPEIGADYYTTTLTISPMKSAPLINSIGDVIGKAYGVKYLFSDFKKNDGYKKSVELSGQYNLYRQNYCGCEFSKRESGES